MAGFKKLDFRKKRDRVCIQIWTTKQIQVQIVHPYYEGLLWTIKLSLCVITQNALHFISHFLSSHCISFAFSHCHALAPPAPPIPFASNPLFCSHSDVTFSPSVRCMSGIFPSSFSHKGQSGFDQLLSAA